MIIGFKLYRKINQIGCYFFDKRKKDFDSKFEASLPYSYLAALKILRKF